MAFNRDLSQLANFLEINSDGTFVNIIPSSSETNLGIGTNNPTAKLDVLGNARVSGNLSATNINASGIVTATSGFVGNLTGLASSATQLATGRTIAITGDLTYTSGSFDGTGNVTGTGTLANTAVTPGSYGSSTEVATFTVDSKGRITAAGTASVGTALTVAGDSGSENISLLSETLTISGGTNLTSSAASNTVTVNLDPNISLTSVVASGVVTATSGFSGNLTGEVNAAAFDTNASGVVVTGITTSSDGFVGALTGNVSGNVTGNINSSGVSTVTSLIATNINASGIVTATSGFVGNLTGTAATTTNIPNLTGDITSLNLATTLATVNSNVGSFGSQTLIPVVTVNAKGLVTAVTTAAVGTALTVAGDSGSEDINLLTESLTISGGTNLTSSAASNTVTVNLDPNISLTSVVASGVITATSGFSGNVTGNLTGDINSSGVSTVTSLNATNINTSGIVTATQFVTGASGSAIGINTNTISGPATITIDPAAVGNNTGLVVIKGDLQIDGTTTTINSTTVTVDDKNIQIADGAANDAAADGAGITITSGDGNKTFQFQDSGDNLGSSENLNVASGKVYKINNTEVLSSTTLGSGVVNSSLTSVGTLTNLNVGNVNSSGIITATTFVGALTGNVTGNVTGNINSSGVSTVTSLNATNINASGIVTATNGFVGNLTGLASSATQLATGRTVAITGDLTYTSGSFNGTGNVTGTGTLATVNSNVGSFGSQTLIPVVTVNAKGLVTAVTTAAVGTALTVTGDSGSENIDLLTETLTISGGTNLTSSAASNSVTVNLDPNISLTSVNASGIITATSGFSGNVTGNLTGEVNAPSFDTNASGVVVTGIATATTFVGALTGNVTGNLTGDINSSGVSTVTSLIATNINASGIVTATSGFVGNLTGTAATTTNIPNLTGDITSVNTATTLATVNSNVGSFGSQTLIPVVTVNAKGLVTAVTTAAVGTALTVTGDSGSENIDLLTETLTISGGTNLTSSAASNTVTVNLDPNISLTSVVASGIITATSGFVGNLTGNVTGNINSSGVSTVTSLNATNINASGIITATQFVTGASGSAIGINTNTISGPETITIDPAAVGDNTGAVRIKGDLFVDGTQFIVNSTTIELADFVVGIASTATTDILADGAGIKIGPDNTLTYDHTNTALKSSENFNLASGKTYKINGTEVLSSNTLGSGVVNSSLTSVGTLTNLSVGNVNSTGIVTATSGFVGNITGNINSSGVSTVTNLNIGGYVSIGNTIGAANQIIASTGVGVTWKTFNDLLPQTRTTQTFTATAGQTLFSFVYNVNFLDVFVNGVKLSSGEFTASNGSTITLSEAAFANDTVEFVSYSTLGAGTGQVSSLNDLTDVTLSGIATGNLLAYNGSEFVNTSTLSNITALDAITTATIEAAVGAAPNNFTSLNISGISTLNGLVDINNDVDISGNLKVVGISTLNNVVVGGATTALVVNGDARITGILTIGTSTLTLDGSNNQVNVGSATTITTSGFRISNSFLHSTGLSLGSGNITSHNINSTGIITATSFVGNLTGLASSATQLETGRTIAITGDLTYTSGSFNGTGNVTGTGTLATVNSNVGSFGSQTLIPVVTVNAKGLVTAVTTAAVGTALTVSGDSGSENINLLSETLTISGGTNLTSSAASNSVTVNLDPNISLTSVNASGIITAAQFVTGASGSAIGINTNTISGPATITIDPAAVGDNTGLVVIAGNLQVDGTTTTINSTTMTVDDINITLASGAASSAAANGAGITIDGASATLLYASTGDKWVFNKDVEAGNFNSTSDINLKENIRQVESASELVSKLEGVHFSWKETGKETIGVIAQQIEEHLPQLVQTGDTHKTVNYNGLIGVLIEAVKEQGAQIAALQAEIEELKK